jgi:hypothetical protein
MDNTLLLAYSRNLNGKKDDIFDITYLRKLVYMFEDTDKKICKLKSNVNGDLKASNAKSDKLANIMNKKPLVNKSDKIGENQRPETEHSTKILKDINNKKNRLPKINENKEIYSSSAIDTFDSVSSNSYNSNSIYSLSSWESSSNFYTQVSSNLKEYKKLPTINEKVTIKPPSISPISNLSSSNKSVKLPAIKKKTTDSFAQSNILPNKPILKKTNKKDEDLNDKYRSRLNKIITDIRKVRIEENINKSIDEINRSKKEMEEFLGILNEFERNNSILGIDGDNRILNQTTATSNLNLNDQKTEQTNNENNFNSVSNLSEDGNLAMLKFYEDKIYKDLKKIAPNSLLTRMNTEAYMNTYKSRNVRFRPSKLNRSIEPSIEESIELDDQNNSSDHFRFVKLKTNSNLYRLDAQKRKQRLSKQIQKAMKLSELVEKANHNDILRNNQVYLKDNLIKAYENWNTSWKKL